MSLFAKFQIGKNGITQGAIDSLSLLFKNYKQVRISLLPSSGRNRDNIDSMADEILTKVKAVDSKHSFRCKVIGFTIIINKESLQARK